MNINEVENLTGLTAKSIRLYEEVGLINVAGNKDNNYTEEDVKTLKYIRLYRFIGFSIDEIKCMLADSNVANTKVNEMLEEIKDSKERLQYEDDICRQLINKNMQYGDDDLDKYIEHINIIESEEYEEAGGQQKIERKKANKGWLWTIGAIIFFIPATVIISMLFFIPVVFIYPIQREYFITAVANGNLPQSLMLIYSVLVGMYVVLKIKSKITSKPLFDFNINRKNKRKILIIFILVSAMVMYNFLANMVIVTDEYIAIHTTFNPVGKTYGYEDIEKIKAGYDHKGEAYYEIWISGKGYDLTDLITANEKYEDTYDEIYVFDKIAAKYNIKKETSHNDEDISNLDDKYKKKFAEILDN